MHPASRKLTSGVRLIPDIPHGRVAVSDVITDGARALQVGRHAGFGLGQETTFVDPDDGP